MASSDRSGLRLRIKNPPCPGTVSRPYRAKTDAGRHPRHSRSKCTQGTNEHKTTSSRRRMHLPDARMRPNTIFNWRSQGACMRYFVTAPTCFGRHGFSFVTTHLSLRPLSFALAQLRETLLLSAFSHWEWLRQRRLPSACKRIRLGVLFGEISSPSSGESNPSGAGTYQSPAAVESEIQCLEFELAEWLLMERDGHIHHLRFSC
ncbi:hypothetical protein B0T14DRAFT_176384 [Immersiella caudata]|uniref:Uncharacterized protein n=1 Tax=Immersiella caudata TaxID=314043 RepID=A0AA40C393_9PEZI|nr:hypothetical protein B0T14DRAFT_176384 [Immersiella caudata]